MRIREFRDPQTLSDFELRAEIHAALAYDAMFPKEISEDEKRFNAECLTEYIKRDINDHVIDGFIEYVAMMGLQGTQTNTPPDLEASNG